MYEQPATAVKYGVLRTCCKPRYPVGVGEADRLSGAPVAVRVGRSATSRLTLGGAAGTFANEAGGHVPYDAS